MKNEKKFYCLAFFPFLLAMFLIFSPSAKAAIEVTGMFTLTDSEPSISSIEAYSSDNYKNPKSNFSIESKEIYFKIKAMDTNGYNDVKKVEVKIVLLNESKEQDFRFSNYADAVFNSGSGTEATYLYSFSISPKDELAYYRLKAVVFDKDNLSSEADFDYSLIKEPIPITGLAVGREGEGIMTRIFRNFMRWFGFLE